MILTLETVLLFILIVHYFADFTLQTHEQAINKHKRGTALFYHVLTYSLAWAIPAYIILGSVPLATVFVLITFMAHWVTDAVTSNLAKFFFDKEDYHNGFVVIGFDQMLHYIQLYLTFKLLV